MDYGKDVRNFDFEFPGVANLLLSSIIKSGDAG